MSFFILDIFLLENNIVSKLVSNWNIRNALDTPSPNLSNYLWNLSAKADVLLFCWSLSSSVTLHWSGSVTELQWKVFFVLYNLCFVNPQCNGPLFTSLYLFWYILTSFHRYSHFTPPSLASPSRYDDIPLFQLFQLTGAILLLGWPSPPWPPLAGPNNVYCRHPTKCQIESLVELSLLSSSWFYSQCFQLSRFETKIKANW